MDIHQILKDTFGYTQFRDKQEQIINHVLDDKDALVIMPTGGGKSMCYQIPALVNPGLTVVISPLIALMNDQVSALRELDVEADALHSNIDSNFVSEIYNDIESGHLKMLYVSPEKILSENFLHFLKNQKISLFAIDEAHCVSVWGNDFRPEYVKLAQLKEHFPEVPTIALTATADNATQADISKQLKLNDPTHFVSSFERKNINTAAKSGIKRIEQIFNFLLPRENEAGIVYCLSRKSTESVASKLQARGFKAEAYHAGLDAAKRKQVQDDFQNDILNIVCATIAFGMGIDKPNIRWVIHYNMPKNIEGYYQEIGRGGRDGNYANALLFYSWGDYLNLQKFIDDSEATQQFKAVQRAKLQRMWEFATANSCRTNLVLNYFGEYKHTKCNHCDNCINPQELFDGTRYAQMALSGIIRTHQHVGINLLIDILRGSSKQEVRQGNYDKIKTFGVGREVPFIHWKHYITQMINQGIIAIDFTDYSRLKITPLSQNVLQGKTKIELAKFVSPEERKKPIIQKIKFDDSDADVVLLDKLKQWRRAKANKMNAPAFVILHDKSLRQIASVLPDSEMKLLSIEGIGKAKMTKYGKEILELVASHSTNS
ncbi:MAG: DNA helicase RecQ [Saprospiraceae bacterium]|nr:DNA helicase RecQ [Bacteroidia bacterium]NNE13556.1 DNA helicase RecQ [Saprospiraceae bacterium]NNL93068.1 DNA helicase RecQ [Saprospiraceae bacterium]